MSEQTYIVRMVVEARGTVSGEGRRTTERALREAVRNALAPFPVTVRARINLEPVGQTPRRRSLLARLLG